LELVEEAATRGIALDGQLLRTLFSDLLSEAILAGASDPTRLADIVRFFQQTRRLGIEPELERPQELLLHSLPTVPASDELRQLAALLGLAPDSTPTLFESNRP
jgi:hypothetical protein